MHRTYERVANECRACAFFERSPNQITTMIALTAVNTRNGELKCYEYNSCNLLVPWYIRTWYIYNSTRYELKNSCYSHEH